MFLDMVRTDPAAFAAFVFGATCLVIWPMFKSHRMMLFVQMGIGVGFGAHYALEHHPTAAAQNLLGMLQIACILTLSAGKARYVGFLIIAAMLASGALTWEGNVSILSTVGTLLISSGRMRPDGRSMKCVVLAGLGFWLWHDLVVTSIVVFADLFSIIVGAITLLPDAKLQIHTLDRLKTYKETSQI